MDLAGVGTKGVADRVRGREADGEQVRRPAPAQTQRASALERKREGERVHRRDAGERHRGLRAVGGQVMREHEARAAILVRDAIRLGVVPCGKQQVPHRSRFLERQASRVEGSHPQRQRVSVIAARREVPRLVPVHRLLGAADRQDRPTVLARHGQRPGVRLGRLKPVEELRTAEPRRRRARTRQSNQGRGRVQHPHGVGDDARVGGPTAREDRRVSRSGLGDRVVLIGVSENRAFAHEQAEAALQLGAIAVQVVRPQLVDGDDHDEPRPRGRSGCKPHRGEHP